MTPAIETKQEQFDIEAIGEYVREEAVEKVEKPQPRSYSQDFLNSASEVISVARAIKSAVVPNAIDLDEEVDEQKSKIRPDVLETLWPGVHHDFSHNIHVKRTPSYYLVLGFMGGAVVALMGAWSCSVISSLVTNYGKPNSSLAQPKASPTQASAVEGVKGIRVPLVPIYEVQEGDTLAGIALKNYKHVSPRLLDEICKANNLTDPNVLVLGQKLNLPEYHY